MTEKELFMQWIEKENAPLLQEAQEGSQFHKDILDYMFMGWQASAKREGFVLMPRKPTQQIYRAFYDAFNSANAGNTAQCFKVGYKAMLSAVEVQNGLD